MSLRGTSVFPPLAGACRQVLSDAAESDEEIGVGLDVEPVDGALESARWSLDQAVCVLHDMMRWSASHGVTAALQEPAVVAPGGPVPGH